MQSTLVAQVLLYDKLFLLEISCGPQLRTVRFVHCITCFPNFGRIRIREAYETLTHSKALVLSYRAFSKIVLVKCSIFAFLRTFSHAGQACDHPI